MSIATTKYNRRSFLKISAASGGGFILGFNWLMSCSPDKAVREIPSDWFNINAYLKIAENGMVTIMSPNPEVGQNVKTSMPMIVAEELDIDWKDVLVEQAPLDTDHFERQVAGGSQSIRQSWDALRTAGATARIMLVNAAAQQWKVDPSGCKTEKGMVLNANGDKVSYGQVATLAATMKIPEKVNLKDPKDFTLIGTPRGNVDIDKIITGRSVFGLDYKKDGMKIAVVLRPPAFGTKLKSFDDSGARNVNGVVDVIRFGEKIAVLAENTWAAIKGQKALVAEWEDDGKLESTSYHNETLHKLLFTPTSKPMRNDGDVVKAFKEADNVIEKIYEAPFLPHNTMEPMNFFAAVTADKVMLAGPVQTPERTRRQIAELLRRNEKDISLEMTRIGGGFGRRLRGDFALEAAEISSLSGMPVKVVYTREDDMTAGIYRPASKYRFRAAVKDGKMTAYHLIGAGINMRNSTRENNFPAGSLANYKIESHNLESNITTGAWRAPITNFLAFAEQSFIDEVAHEIGTDPVQFRLDLINNAIKNPVGKLGYEPEKLAGVIRLAAEKGNWGRKEEGISQGFSAYYAHNSYVAELSEVQSLKDRLKIKKFTCAVDCGILVNPMGAVNQVQGGIVDGIGHAMYGNFTFYNGQPQVNNFDKYRLIRINEAPEEIDVHFVKSENHPTGLGEPALPPAAAALANALFAATGKRFYKQPFSQEFNELSRKI